MRFEIEIGQKRGLDSLMTALSNRGLAFVFNKGSTPRVGRHDISKAFNHKGHEGSRRIGRSGHRIIGVIGRQGRVLLEMELIPGLGPIRRED